MDQVTIAKQLLLVRVINTLKSRSLKRSRLKLKFSPRELSGLSKISSTVGICKHLLTVICLTTGWILRRMKKFTIRARVKCSKCFRRWTKNRRRKLNLVRWNHQASTCQQWFTSRRGMFQPHLQSLKLPLRITVMESQK